MSDFGILGAGTAGAALALFLARAGHAVTLYEAVADPRPIGAGIVLQPSGQTVLSMLGLLGPILDRGARIDRLHCVRAATRGPHRTVVDLDYRTVGEGTFGLGLHRGALFSVLHEAVRAEPRITLRTGFEVAQVKNEGARRAVVATPECGAERGLHDAVIIADGAGSDIVTDDPLPRRVRTYGWGALWCVAPDPDRVFRGMLYQVVKNAEHMLGFLPTGTSPTDPEPVVSLYWSLRADRVEAFRAGGLAAFKAQVLAYEPRAAFVLDTIQAPEQLLFASYRDVTTPSGVWHGGRTVRIGDAAHATSPQLGQGANLALIDAAVLAAALTDGVGANGVGAEATSIEAALSTYSKRRRAQLGYYQWATRWLTPFFQGDSRILPFLRDVGMPIGLAIPYVRRQMVMSMAGIHRGLFRAPMSLEPKRLVSGD